MRVGPPAPDEVLRALAASHRLRVRLSWSDPRGGRTVARGTGRLRVERPGPEELITRELGSWQAGADGPVRFRTATRWTIRDEALHVAHVRRGPARPVPLVALVPRDGDLVAAEAHRCGEDLYRSALRLGNDGAVTLVWTVRGPRKDQRLAFRFCGDRSVHGAPSVDEGRRLDPDTGS